MERKAQRLTQDLTVIASPSEAESAALYAGMSRTISVNLPELIFVEEAVELDVLSGLPGSSEAVAPSYLIDLLEIHDGKTIVIEHRRDLSVIMLVELAR